ncbi:YlmH/Sll1252 family protein [Anaerobium acetethylicum]|uniref:RNA-binding protein YlmH, contains S4-like domain n=1 Tax=Anaerobium acetethylicum TaxID=1619234 RepID=A0A1D3TNW8_9FIRM|nr:YlmH/Sll1252 family protein [Anaerobium acetethylicum]SCP95026.1 RNA-binding protein YlmH, contains S4-like domain [Anaerobium acetethylicum]
MTKEELILQKKLIDTAFSAYYKNIVTFTDFLNLNELKILHSTHNEFPAVRWETFGGYGLAERQMAAFIPEDLYYEIEYPLICVKVEPLNRKFSDSLTHRDFLGAVLNLGIDRSRIGDIVVKDNTGYIIAACSFGGFLANELVRVKHTNVRTTIDSLENISSAQEFDEICGSVASARIDSIMALAFSSSRSSMSVLAEDGNVFINGRQNLSNSTVLKPDDIVSIRGKGKFIFKEVVSQTKKGRYFIKILKYV